MPARTARVSAPSTHSNVPGRVLLVVYVVFAISAGVLSSLMVLKYHALAGGAEPLRVEVLRRQGVQGLAQHGRQRDDGDHLVGAA